METRTIAEISGVIILLASMGVIVSLDDASDKIYSCDIESAKDMYCFKLSKVNANGIQRNCYYDNDNPRRYKICSAGWEKISLEQALEKQIPQINQPYHGSTETCTKNGCK